MLRRLYVAKGINAQTRGQDLSGSLLQPLLALVVCGVVWRRVAWCGVVCCGVVCVW